MNTKKLDDINFIVLMLIDIRATYSFIFSDDYQRLEEYTVSRKLSLFKSLIDTCTLAIENNSKCIVICHRSTSPLYACMHFTFLLFVYLLYISM